MVLTYFLELSSLCVVGLGILYFHFCSILKRFEFFPEFFHSIVSCSVSMNLQTFYCFCWCGYPALLHGGQMGAGCCFSFLVSAGAWFLPMHVVSFGEGLMRSCVWVKYLLGPFGL